MKYRLKKIMMYTEELEVEVESKTDAEKYFIEKADEFERVHDDHWYDQEIVEITQARDW